MNAPLTNEKQFYRVEEVIRSKAECECPACVQWTVVYDSEDGPTEIGTSWQGDEGKDLAEDICDLMNMAFDAGAESVQQHAGIKTHRAWLLERAQWLQKERMNGGNWEYLKNKEEETRYCLEKLNAHVPALDVSGSTK